LVLYGDVLVIFSLFVYNMFTSYEDAGRWLYLSAFTLHATAVCFASYWSYSVSANIAADTTDGAKAGEAVRGLCAIWVVLAASFAVAMFLARTELLESLTGAKTFVVALTITAVVITMRSGYTKYVEGRDHATLVARAWRSESLSRDAARLTPEWQRRCCHLSARILAAAGPLSSAEIRSGFLRSMHGSYIPSLGTIHAVLDSSPSFTLKDTKWSLANGSDNYLWPTDRRLQNLAMAGDWEYSQQEMMTLLSASGYTDSSNLSNMLVHHPLIRKSSRNVWYVLPYPMPEKASTKK